MPTWYRTYDAKKIIGVLLAIILVGAFNCYRLQTLRDPGLIKISNQFLFCVLSLILFSYALFVVRGNSVQEEIKYFNKVVGIYSILFLPLLVVGVMNYDDNIAPNISKSLFGRYGSTVSSVPSAYVFLEGETTRLGADLDVQTLKGFIAQQGPGWLVVTHAEPPDAFNAPLPLKWPASAPVEEVNWGNKIRASGTVSSNSAILKGTVQMPSPIDQVIKIKAYLFMPVIYPIKSGAGRFFNKSTYGRGGSFTIVILPLRYDSQLEIFRNTRSSVVSLLVLSLPVPLIYSLLLTTPIFTKTNKG